MSAMYAVARREAMVVGKQVCVGEEEEPRKSLAEPRARARTEVTELIVRDSRVDPDAYARTREKHKKVSRT